METEHEIELGQEAEAGERQFESRFGNKEAIIEAMMAGEVIEVGPIDEIYPDTTPEHANEVNIVDVKKANANAVLGVKIQKGGEVIRCVFKPADGENSQTKTKTGIKKFYPRECAAYLASEHFGLDIVPPTVIREIGGRIGAMQLFLDHGEHRNCVQEDFDNMVEVNNEGKIERVSADLQALMVLDWLLVNPDRHQHNAMVSKSDPNKLFAIDHGIVLRYGHYAHSIPEGPASELCFDHKNRQIRQVPISPGLITKIQKRLECKEELTPKLRALNSGSIEDYEVDLLWDRAQLLVKHGVFLSKYNCRQVTGETIYGSHSHK